jgi:hypothetical protein
MCRHIQGKKRLVLYHLLPKNSSKAQSSSILGKKPSGLSSTVSNLLKGPRSWNRHSGPDSVILQLYIFTQSVLAQTSFEVCNSNHRKGLLEVL